MNAFIKNHFVGPREKLIDSKLIKYLPEGEKDVVGPPDFNFMPAHCTRYIFKFGPKRSASDCFVSMAANGCETLETLSQCKVMGIFPFKFYNQKNSQKEIEKNDKNS